MVRAPVFQTGDEGSIPFTRSLIVQYFYEFLCSLACCFHKTTQKHIALPRTAGARFIYLQHPLEGGYGSERVRSTFSSRKYLCTSN